jgi:hypothetical protein
MKMIKVRLLWVVPVAVLLGFLTLPIVFLISGRSRDLVLLLYPLPCGLLWMSGSDDYFLLAGILQLTGEGLALALPDSLKQRLRLLAYLLCGHLVIWGVLRLWEFMR